MCRLMLQHHAHGTFPDFRGVLVRRTHGSLLSSHKPSGKPGTVHTAHARRPRISARTTTPIAIGSPNQGEIRHRTGERTAMKARRRVLDPGDPTSTIKTNLPCAQCSAANKSPQGVPPRAGRARFPALARTPSCGRSAIRWRTPVERAQMDSQMFGTVLGPAHRMAERHQPTRLVS